MSKVDYAVRARSPGSRRVYFHQHPAPRATAVVPKVFVSVRDLEGRLLLVRRRDSGTWELPGGRVDVGESAVTAATREVQEESGLRVEITGLVGLFTDPAHVVESATGDEVRQQFTVCLHAIALEGSPLPDMDETIEAAWFDPPTVAGLSVEPAARRLITQALSGADEPYLE